MSQVFDTNEVDTFTFLSSDWIRAVEEVWCFQFTDHKLMIMVYDVEQVQN